MGDVSSHLLNIWNDKLQGGSPRHLQADAGALTGIFQ